MKRLICSVVIVLSIATGSKQAFGFCLSDKELRSFLTSVMVSSVKMTVDVCVEKYASVGSLIRNRYQAYNSLYKLEIREDHKIAETAFERQFPGQGNKILHNNLTRAASAGLAQIQGFSEGDCRTYAAALDYYIDTNDWDKILDVTLTVLMPMERKNVPRC
jgi:hypothetical protein